MLLECSRRVRILVGVFSSMPKRTSRLVHPSPLCGKLKEKRRGRGRKSRGRGREEGGDGRREGWRRRGGGIIMLLHVVCEEEGFEANNPSTR